MMMLFVMAMFVANVAFADDMKSGDNMKSTSTAKPEKMEKKSMSKGLLDGKEFVGTAGPVDSTGSKETITFMHGKFHSVACDAYGFTPAPYTATANSDGSISFSATCTSPKMGKMEWTGTVTGDNLDATAVNTMEGKDPMKMWAKGTMEAMPAMGKKEHKTMHKASATTKSTSGN